MMGRILAQVALWSMLCLSCSPRACRCGSASTEPPVAPSTFGGTVSALSTPTPAPTHSVRTIAEVVYDKGFQNGWQDWGWAPHEFVTDGPVKVRFDNWAGLILAKPGNSGEFGGIVLRMKPVPGQPDFLQVSLWSDAEKMTPVPVGKADETDVGDGWVEVFLPMERLNPSSAGFDRIVLHPSRITQADLIPIDHIALTKPVPQDSSGAPAAIVPAKVNIKCDARSNRISPDIYGFAYYPFDDEAAQQAQWLLKGTVRRWGGNVTSTYNWELGAWNTGSDYFYENHPISHQKFLDENAAHNTASAVTVPIMGWVAKDVTSSSFPVSVFGAQQATDQWRQGAGNGIDQKGKEIDPKSPPRAYRQITPSFVKKWVESIRQWENNKGKRNVRMYILDNEPMLWNHTHRDAHPEPASYDELLTRTIEFGTAVREADPEAIIAGPAEWGWMGYMYSAKDLANGGHNLRPDRRAHGDLPLVAYYLKALAEHEKKTGVRILDVFDLHAYPYADGVHSARSDKATAELRLRSTRMMWDPTYADESWVKEPVKLLPRMREWVDQFYPGRGISVGEWNFGGEMHMSGALAVSEVLGRFAQSGVTSAFYWTYPPANSPAMWAFRAFRDFDGRGGRFLDWYTPSSVETTKPKLSAFVSRDDSGKHVVAVLINSSNAEAFSADLDLASCGKLESTQAWTYNGQPGGFKGQATEERVEAGKMRQALPPYSITVLDVRLKEASRVVR